MSTAGKIKIRNGKLLVKAGKIARCDVCCEECEYCDVTPETLELVLSDFEFCCYYWGVYGVAAKYSDPDGFLSAPVVLTRNVYPVWLPEPCWWYTTFTLTRTLTTATYDPNNDCDGEVISTTEVDCEIVCRMESSTTWELVIRTIVGDLFFHADISDRTEGDCASALVFTNTEGPCQGNDHTTPKAAGGTATVNVP